MSYQPPCLKALNASGICPRCTYRIGPDSYRYARCDKEQK